MTVLLFLMVLMAGGSIGTILMTLLTAVTGERVIINSREEGDTVRDVGLFR